MADTYTPNFGLTLCEVGASRDTWGSKWNTNLTEIDQFLAFAMPIGAILDFAGPTPPHGWLVADGRAISRITYSALFAVLGTYFGAGDGSTTFALPNLCGRASVGPGSITDGNGTTLSLTFAQTLGNLSNYIQQAHLPNYTLTTAAAGVHNHSGVTMLFGSHNHTTDTQGYHSHGGVTTGDNPYHTHSGTVDYAGDHNHYTTLPNVANAFGTNPFGVMTTAAGNTNYYTNTAGGHQHTFTTGIVNQAHTHGIYADGSHAHTTTTIGDHSHGIYNDGSHSHTVTLGGSGGLFSLIQPSVVVTKIIYAGNQAAVAAAVVIAPTEIEGRDELAAIREELAQLRALFAPAQRQPRLAAPLRGPH